LSSGVLADPEQAPRSFLYLAQPLPYPDKPVKIQRHRVTRGGKNELAWFERQIARIE